MGNLFTLLKSRYSISPSQFGTQDIHAVREVPTRVAHRVSHSMHKSLFYTGDMKYRQFDAFMKQRAALCKTFAFAKLMKSEDLNSYTCTRVDYLARKPCPCIRIYGSHHVCKTHKKRRILFSSLLVSCFKLATGSSSYQHPVTSCRVAKRGRANSVDGQQILFFLSLSGNMNSM